MRAFVFSMILTSLPAAAQAPLQLEGGVLCRDGDVVAVRVNMPRPGWVTLQIPPGVCRQGRTV